MIQNLYAANEIVTVYLCMDRMVTLGCMSTTEAVSIDKGIDHWKNFSVRYFLGRREIGTFNTGDSGRIVANGQGFRMEYKNYLYITRGTKGVYFSSDDASTSVKSYMVSTSTHTSYTTTHIPITKAAKRLCGAPKTVNKRVVNQFIHPGVLKTYQPSMGMIVLEEGSVWNTMSAHTHERRMGVYIHLEVPGDSMIFHTIGEPTEARHIVMKNEEAVTSPSWGIHNGAGMFNYMLIWTMGGKNMEFNDMDTITPNQIK